MIEILSLLFSSIGMYLTGFSIINLSKQFRKFSFLEKLGYSYGLGLGMISFVMFVLSILHIPLTRFSILFPIFSFWIFSAIFENVRVHYKISRVKLSKINKILLFVITISVIYVLFEAMVRPLAAWDGWSTWYFAGKAFYIDKNMSVGSLYPYGHFEMPPVIPLLISYTYIIIGKESEALSLFNFYLFYINILALFYSNLKRYSSIFVSLIFTFLLATLPVVVRHAGRYDIGHADLPLSYFFFGSVLLLGFFIKKRTQANLLFLEFFIGICALIKNEGMAFFLIMQCIIFLILLKEKNFSKKIFVSYSIGFLPLAVWTFYKTFLHIPPIYLLSDSPHFERLPNILFLLPPEFLNIQRWNFLWPVFFLLLFYSLYKKLFKDIYLLFPIFLQFLVYIYIYVITSGDKDYVTQIHGTLDRLLLHLVPIVVLWVGIQCNYFLYGFFKKKSI